MKISLYDFESGQHIVGAIEDFDNERGAAEQSCSLLGMSRIQRNAARHFAVAYAKQTGRCE